MRRTAFIVAFLAAICAARADRFLLATFNNGEQQLRILSSTNAADFTGHAEGIVYTPPAGSSLRDPSIIRHGDSYYVCHTTGNFGQTNVFSIIRSDDLKTWTHLTDVSMAAIGDVRWVWAPEWFRDDDGSLHILVSASTTERITVKHTIYELHPTSPDDLTRWSTPVAVAGTNAFPPWTEAETFVGTYDPYVVKRGGSYWMFFFNVRSSCIELARSTNALTGPYEPVQTGNWQRIGVYKEGPTVMYLGGGRWRMIYADAIYSYLSYTDSTDNWATWSAPQAITLPGAPTNFTVNHGTLIMPPGGLEADLRVQPAGAGTWNVSFNATAGDHYRLSTSTNLTDWTPDALLGPTPAGLAVHPVEAASDERRFWRLERQLP